VVILVEEVGALVSKGLLRFVFSEKGQEKKRTGRLVTCRYDHFQLTEAGVSAAG
jgi:hypothetical protein